MKIDVIGTRGFPGIQGGVERHCERLYPSMPPVFQIRVFRRRPYLNPEYANAAYPHIRFCDLPSTRIKGFEAVAHSFLATAISAFSKSDVVHIHNIGPAMFTPLLRAFGKKIVLTYHSANYEHDKWNPLEKILLRTCEKIALAAANKIIFVNRFQLKKYPAKIQAKSVYIPNGVVPLQRSEQTDFLQQIGVESGKYILSVGRLTPEKGFDILIEAFAKLETGMKLVIAGAADHHSDYIDMLEKAASRKNVVFAGFVDGENLSQLYSHAAAYVLASRVEGFPLVLLEAINANLPLLVSDISASHLLSLPQKSYFKPDDIEALSGKLAEFLHSDRNEYRCTAENITDYDWEKIAQRTADVYRSCFRQH